MDLTSKTPYILLLETPFMSQTGTDEIRAYVQSKYNLALLALGSYLRAYSSLNVRLINMVRDNISEKGLIDRLRVSPPAVIGISLYSYSLSLTYRIISSIKAALPDVHICVGGPHVNIFSRETLNLKDIDSIVLGDGELPFLEICKQIVQSGRLASSALPPGTYTKESLASPGEMAPYFVKDVEELPILDLTLLGDYRRYKDFLSNRTLGLLYSSRGCPFACHYCWSEKSHHRMFSIEHVMRTLRSYKELGVQYVEFWDETFNPNKKRLDQLADAILDADLGLSWTVRGAVVNHVPLDTLLKLKRSGLRLMQFGVETGNPRLLRLLNKRIDRQQVKAAFANCHKAGIRTAANLMINIPGQTRNEILSDLDLLKELRPTYVSVSIYNWAPGTTLYDQALHSGVLERDHWREFATVPEGPEPVFHALTETPIEEVYRLRSQFVMKHYFDARYLLEYVRAIDRSEISRAASIALSMLRCRFQRQAYDLTT